MKKIFLALMAVAAIALTGCNKEDVKDNPPSSDNTIVITVDGPEANK